MLYGCSNANRHLKHSSEIRLVVSDSHSLFHTKTLQAAARNGSKTFTVGDYGKSDKNVFTKQRCISDLSTKRIVHQDKFFRKIKYLCKCSFVCKEIYCLYLYIINNLT